jgi:hypothetical protein
MRKFARLFMLVLVVATLAAVAPQLSGGCGPAGSQQNPCAEPTTEVRDF